jgi:hypothetical protein
MPETKEEDETNTNRKHIRSVTTQTLNARAHGEALHRPANSGRGLDWILDEPGHGLIAAPQHRSDKRAASCL